jgi:hypothetical protein
MKSLHVVLDVLLVLALGLMIWQNHHLRTQDSDLLTGYAEELNRLSNKQSGCETQLRACYMDLDAIELNGEGKSHEAPRQTRQPGTLLG